MIYSSVVTCYLTENHMHNKKKIMLFNRVNTIILYVYHAHGLQLSIESRLCWNVAKWQRKNMIYKININNRSFKIFCVNFCKFSFCRWYFHFIGGRNVFSLYASIIFKFIFHQNFVCIFSINFVLDL